jgi:hypothetical protein
MRRSGRIVPRCHLAICYPAITLGLMGAFINVPQFIKVTKNVGNGLIDFRIAAAAFLARWAAAVTDHGNDEPMLEMFEFILVAR